MGAEREDTDSSAGRVGTEPGLGKASGATPAASPAVSPPVPAQAAEDDEGGAVDFDALNAALGNPLDYHELPSGPSLPPPGGGEPAASAGGKGVRIGESSGAKSATYASARPHTIPPTRAPVEDPNEPAVIVASDTDTVPSAAPQMTAPLGTGPHAVLFAPGHPGHAGPPHGGPPGHPSSGQQPALPPHGAGYIQTPQPTPQPFKARGIPQMTIRMPDRPINPRRGKSPTVVVRPRGPSAKQKLLAFMAMLLLVTACGIAVIVWRKPGWLGLDGAVGGPSATTSASGAPVAPPGTGGVTITPVTPVGAGTTSPASVPAKKGTKATPAPTNTAGRF